MLAEGTLLSVTFSRDKTASVSRSFTSFVFLGFYFSLCYFHCSIVVAIILLLQLLKHSYLNPGIFSLSPFQFTSFFLLQQRSQEVPVWCSVAGWGWTMTLLFQTAALFFFLSLKKPATCIGTNLSTAIDLLNIPCVCQTYLFNLFSRHKCFWGLFPHAYQSEYTEKNPKLFCHSEAVHVRLRVWRTGMFKTEKSMNSF